jgi:hypothetical protein
MYQCCLQLGTAASQGRYASRNHFAGFTGTDKEYASNNNTAKTIACTISSHFANLSTQTAAMIEANTLQVNASLQQLANNNTQLQQQQQANMQQMVLFSTNATTPCNNAYVQLPMQIYAPPPYRISNSSTSRGVEVMVAEAVAVEAIPNMAMPWRRTRHLNAHHVYHGRPWLGKLPTYRQHVGPTAKCWHFWPTSPCRGDTKPIPTQYFCVGDCRHSPNLYFSTRATY